MNANTGILGYFGCRNAGDDAFFDYWKRSFSVPESQLYSNCREEALSSVMLGGGALINDYFLSRLPSPLSRLGIVGCSFPYGDGDIDLLRRHWSKIELLHLRSKRDAAIAQAIYPETRYVPDVIFDHTFDPESRISLEGALAECALPPLQFDYAKENAIILVSDHYSSSNLQRFIQIEAFKFELASALDVLSERFNIIFIPMSIWYDARDNVFAAEIVSKMNHGKNATIIDRYLGADKIYNFIAEFGSIVISMKYHGLIFSMRANVPFINIGDTRKNIDLLSDNDLLSLNCSAQRFQRDHFLDTVTIATNSSIRDHIRYATEEAQYAVGSSRPAISEFLDK